MSQRRPTREDERYSTFEFGSLDFGFHCTDHDELELEFGDDFVSAFDVDEVDEVSRHPEDPTPRVVHEGVL